MKISPGLVMVILIGSLSLFGPPILGTSPYRIDMTRRLLAPSAEHWFGTDTLGRDLLARVLTGGRISLGIGLSTAFLSAFLALLIGLCADGILETVLMGLCDTLRAVPALLLAIALMAALGGNAVQLVIVLALGSTPVTARLVRACALTIRSQPYVEAARIQGAGRGRILLFQVLPNILRPLAVQMSYTCAQAMTAEAALSYLGAGIKPPLPSWGNILQEGQTVIFSAPWMILFPGLFAALSILGINLLGNGLGR
ncbi:MAG: ABC transporter permease [Treponema sp.]|jgi:peptide/nickel transport system permease protein|nr:ABC transporter permease [Treponema sp.]